MPTDLPPPIPGNGPTIAGSPWLIAETTEEALALDDLDERPPDLGEVNANAATNPATAT